jgi:hypothetical protein
MKKLFILALVLVSLPSYGFVTRNGGSYSTSDPEKEFLRVKSGESSTAIAIGDALCADTSADDGVTAKICTSSGKPVLCVAAQAIVAGAWGKCQTYGYMSALKVSGVADAVVAGSGVVMSPVSGRGDGASSGKIFAIALDAASTTTTIPAIIIVR